MVVSGTDRSMLKYTSLKDLETFYNEIVLRFPKKYGWYQCRWHMEAGTVYNRAGIAVIQKLWVLLEKQEDKLRDEALAVLLDEKVH